MNPRIKKKDGSFIFVTLNISIPKDKPYTALIVGHDITERKAAEEEIKKLLEQLNTHKIELEIQNDEYRLAHRETKEARDKYLDLYDYAPVGYLSLDGSGDIILANKTAADLLGATKSKLIHSPFSNFITPGSQDAFHFHMNQTLETGTGQKTEILMRRKDGTVFNAHIESTAERFGGKTADIRLTLSDITDLLRSA